MRLVDVPSIVDFDGESCQLRWWQSSLGHEPVIAEIAVGDFAQTLLESGEDVAYPTAIAAMGRALKYYFQAVKDSPLREDYAEAWGDKLLDAYVTGSTPPKPWPGAVLGDLPNKHIEPTASGSIHQ